MLVSGTHGRLESAVKVSEERVADSELHHAPLDHVAVNVVVLQHDVLLERLNGVVLLRAFQLGQQHLQQTNI